MSNVKEIEETGIYAFKWIDSKGCTSGGGSNYKWSLPVGDKPGEWHSKRKAKKAIKCCGHGFHCVGFERINDFTSYGPRLFLVEVSGKFNAHPDKFAVESVRIVRELKHKWEDGRVIILSKDLRSLPNKTITNTVGGKNYGVVGRDRIGSVAVTSYVSI